MAQRAAVVLILWLVTLMSSPIARADSSGPELASYYERHMALLAGVAYGWFGRGAPQRMRDAVVQVGVSQDAYFALLEDGSLLTWSEAPAQAALLMQGVTSFAVGRSGWFAIDRAQVLWYGRAAGVAVRRVAAGVVAATIGDGADYYVTRDGTLYVKGLAHRGQYGDGRLSATREFVATAHDAVAVKAHTGHALYLRRDGGVMGTGGNRFGPLSSHGLGDKADNWGRIFDAAVTIATGSRHSAAIRANGSLWVWGEGFGVQPKKLLGNVKAVAAGDTATIALTVDGALWQWDGAAGPRRLVPR